MLDRGLEKWQFNLTARLMIASLTILSNSKTFVVSISTIAETFFLLTKRIFTITLVMCGEPLQIVIGNSKKNLKGSTNENMAS